MQNADNRYSKRIKMRMQEQLKISKYCDKRTNVLEFHQCEFLELFELCRISNRSKKAKCDYEVDLVEQQNITQRTIDSINQQLDEMEFLTNQNSQEPLDNGFTGSESDSDKNQSFDVNQNIVPHKYLQKDIELINSKFKSDFSFIEKLYEQSRLNR